MAAPTKTFTIKKMGTIFNLKIQSSKYSESWIEEITSLLEELEESWSRFRESSELSRLNRDRHLDSPTEIFKLALKASINANEMTGGVFEPRILKALENIGYDRTFNTISPTSFEIETSRPISLPPIRDDILITPNQITIRSDARIDFGGIGKCLAIQEVSSWITHQDTDSSFLIDAGGDIIARSSSGQPCWYIDIEDPNKSRPLSFWIRIANGAVATSSPSIRNWKSGAKVKHHLIDPKTMDSSTSDLASVTVVGKVASECEVWSKSLFLMGKEKGAALAEIKKIAAIFIDHKSNVEATTTFDRYIEVRGESVTAANCAEHTDFSSPLSNFTYIHLVH
ncbi:MAG: FAD:protein FMN transferase [Actinomycetota bacterium]|nr:FAD:protein FMN transferase [Actinomycetota bacterium]